MIEVENLADHVKSLREMQSWDVTKILPNHGSPPSLGTAATTRP